MKKLVIIPAYNEKDSIVNTVKDIKDNAQGFDYIVVNDCSTDNTREVVGEYIKKDNRIKYFCLENNSGAAVARTKAMELANGQYMAFLDSDDIWSPAFLESQLSFMREKNAAIVTASYHRINEQGEQVLQPFIVPEKVNYRDILKSNPISCLTTIYDRKVAGDRYFREELKSLRDDYAFWLEILRDKVDYAYGNPKVLASYRLVSTSVTRNRKKLIKPQFLIYYKVEKLGLLRSIYYFINWAIRSVLKYS